MTANPLVTTLEAAAILGQTTRTIQRKAKTGRLPIVRKLDGDRGAYLFAREEIETMAGKGRHETVQS